MQHVYDPQFQNENLVLRTTAALDKLADVFKSLLWQSQKELGLSPLQQKLLIFIATHDSKENTVSNLVEEFQVTKATISECVKKLEGNGWLVKKLDHKDNRRFFMELTAKGTDKINTLTDFSKPIQDALASQKPEAVSELYQALYTLVSRLNKDQVTSLQRSCVDCKAYRSDGMNNAFCMQLRIQLPLENRRLDCPKYQSK